jgi:hypothetical protein
MHRESSWAAEDAETEAGEAGAALASLRNGTEKSPTWTPMKTLLRISFY